MNNRKILIFEDDLLLADDLEHTLKRGGYPHLKSTHTKAKAIQAFEDFSPDVAVLDIHTDNDRRAGIDIARYINEMRPVPVIFLSSHEESYGAALDIHPVAFIEKAHKHNIVKTVDVAINNFYPPQPKIKPIVRLRDRISVHDRGFEVVILLKDILCVTTVKNGIAIQTTDRVFRTYHSLNEFCQYSRGHNFFRIQRSCVINLERLTKFKGTEVWVGDKSFGLSSEKYKQLCKMMNKL